MSKTKTVRIIKADAEELEQIAREVAVKFERNVSVGEVIKALLCFKDQAVDVLFEKEVNAETSPS